jgi:tetratricopeptide (TPR) repeat protein
MKILNLIKYLLGIFSIIYIFLNWQVAIVLFLIASIIHVIPMGPNLLLSVITGYLIIGGVIYLFINLKIGVVLIIGGVLLTKFRIYGNKVNYEYYKNNNNSDMAENKIPYSTANTGELSGEYEEIIEKCNEAIRNNPKDINSYNSKGTGLYKLGKYEESIRVFDEAIKINPKNTIAYFNKGVLFDKLGKYEEAVNMFNEVLKIDPKDTEANNHKVLMLEKLRNK